MWLKCCAGSYTWLDIEYFKQLAVCAS